MNRLDKKGFTLVEIMIVVAIIALLAAIAVPAFIRARLRSQATLVLDELRQVDAAKDQYALETLKAGTFTPTWADLTVYIKNASKLQTSLGYDSLGHSFTIGNVSGRLIVDQATKDAVSDATGGDTFWSSFS